MRGVFKIPGVAARRLKKWKICQRRNPSIRPRKSRAVARKCRIRRLTSLNTFLKWSERSRLNKMRGLERLSAARREMLGQWIGNLQRKLRAVGRRV